MKFRDVNPRQKQAAWREQMLRQLPGRWARALRKRIERMDATHNDWAHGNTYLREQVAAYGDNALPLTATLGDIRDYAMRRALEASGIAERLIEQGAIIAALRALCGRSKVAPPKAATEGGFVARLVDPCWWARRLRKTHGRTVEAQAIRLGMVHGRADKYVSEENLRRVEAQKTRNAEMAARQFVVNEDGEVFTLTQLIDKSIANGSLRRGELMLRFRGMEEVGNEYGCAVEFSVITAPSRFHAARADGSQNDKHSDATPHDTRDYLQAQWKKCQSWLARRGVDYYGMRTVEAHLDGTPHWNLLVFIRHPEHVRIWRQGIEAYFLHNDSPDEPGAREHRVRFETITKEKGSATAYIAKYISKNIDGAGLEHDLNGDPIVNTTRRVEGWTKTWGIRQFQPLGGSAPVTVWRELRRIEESAIANAPEAFVRAWRAAQRVEGATEEQSKRADYAEFIRACGGPWRKRKDASMWLHKVQQQGIGRYGEPLGERPAGIVVRGEWLIDGGVAGAIRAVAARPVESVRRTWTFLKSASADFATSRTRVNNFTHSCESPQFDSAAKAGCNAPFFEESPSLDAWLIYEASFSPG